MGKRMHGSRGFTLIASLLLLLLLSAIAAGLMYTVTGSGHVGSNDLEANNAYYGAESGMEKLTSDLLSLYQQKLSPTQADFNTLAKTSPPSNAQVPGVTYLETVNWTNVNAQGNPITSTGIVSQGPYAGLTAEIIPITLQVSAMRTYGASVNMTRGVEIALIPVFQFGVFSDSDLSYYPGPPFGFLGRVHTNGNLYLNANDGPLVLGDKVTAVGQILRDRLPNNYLASKANGYFGDVYIATSTSACDTFAANQVAGKGGAAPAGCVNWGPDTDNATDDSSWSGGIPTPNGWANTTSFTGTISPKTFNSFAMIGVPLLQLPFVQGAAMGAADAQIEIIRKQETVAELPSSPIGASREYNKANIHILLGDNCAELHPAGGACNADGQDIQLEVQGSEKITNPAVGNAFFALGDPVGTGDINVIAPRCAPNANAQAPYPIPANKETGCAAYPNATWPLVRGWLRVEVLEAGGWTGVTTEWLQHGFARGIQTPIFPNNVHPDAILILQELADRNGSGSVSNGQVQIGTYSSGPNKGKPIMATESTAAVGGTGNNYYPINFYDPREGFPRDNPNLAGTQCYANGIMNAVELDVSNLAKWFAGTGNYAGGQGKNVTIAQQNGYLVYFSDRRGMEPNPNSNPANVTNGESGLEDVINSGDVANGMPDGQLEANTPGYNAGSQFSPEDVDQDGLLDNWGAADIGDGFELNTSGPVGKPNPYVAVDCFNLGRQNWVSGARHVLRLVDGAMSAAGGGTSPLPMPGFTVGAENPVYILGDYNSYAGDSTWQSPSVDPGSHSAASVIADAVTLLSNDWTDLNDMQNPNTLGNRSPVNTASYRLAVASGKGMNFPHIAGLANDFGADGGVHNFLRYIENMGGIQINYRGSMVSMYYSEYATGTFKCCTLVYGAPKSRNYSFDKDFLTPTNLPPGTPMLQDIDTLSYWQNFSPCSTQTGGNCSN